MNYFNYSSLKGKSLPEVILTIVIATILLVILIPFLGFWLSYFMGWVASKLVGDELIKAFSMFDITISKDMIPWIAGLFGWIATFFKSVTSPNN